MACAHKIAPCDRLSVLGGAVAFTLHGVIEYAAVIAVCGVPTRGGWSLEYLAPGEPVPTVRDLPLPLTGMSGTGHGRIGWVDYLV